MSVAITIAVVDDHPVYRAGVVELFRGEPGFHVVAEGDSAIAAMRICAAVVPDVLVMDICMPGDSLAVAREISLVMPQTRIMMLTVVDDDAVATAARDAGAASYALKGIAGPDLVRAIRSLVTGEALIGPSQAERLLREDRAISNSDMPVGSRLALRDRELLEVIVRRGTPEEAAEELGLDMPTLMDFLYNLQAMLQIRFHSNAFQRSAGTYRLH